MFKSLLDSLPVKMVVIDPKGDILYHNNSWDNLVEPVNADLQNYFDILKKLTHPENAEDMSRLANNIHLVIDKQLDHYSGLFPCFTDKSRWFQVDVNLVPINGEENFMICHSDRTNILRLADKGLPVKERHTLQCAIDNIFPYLDEIISAFKLPDDVEIKPSIQPKKSVVKRFFS